MPDTELARTWTRDEVLALPDDGRRYELVDGALLVSPSPRWHHQRAVGEMHLRLARYVTERGIGIAMFSPADLDLQSGQLLQPDLFVVGRTASRRVRDWRDVGVPLLVVEILSPSTARYDRVTKRVRFQRSGVPTYWIVDLDARIVEVWTPDDDRPAIITDVLTWRPDSALPALEIDLPALFAAIIEA